MARVSFTLHQQWSIPADRLWNALADWEGHSEWIPLTRVRILHGDGGLGTKFVARTGIGPLGFDDNMTVIEFDATTTHAVVEKTGPLLKGSAGFRITPTAQGCALEWFETVQVPGLPRILVPLVNKIATAAFAIAFGGLRKHLEAANA